MEVFPWARWGGSDALPPFVLGQTFLPSELLLKEVQQPVPSRSGHPIQSHPTCCGLHMQFCTGMAGAMHAQPHSLLAPACFDPAGACTTLH